MRALHHAGPARHRTRDPGLRRRDRRGSRALADHALFTKPETARRRWASSASSRPAEARRRAPRRVPDGSPDLALDLPRQLPVEIAVFASASSSSPPPAARRARRSSPCGGTIALTAALTQAVYAIVNGETNAWTSTETLGLLGGGDRPLRVLPHPRGARRRPAHAARSLQAPQPVGRERDRQCLRPPSMFARCYFFSALHVPLVLGYSPLEVGLSHLPNWVLIAGALARRSPPRS